MKKIVVTLLFLVPFLSGCAKIDANLSINNNKSAGIEINMQSDKQARPLELSAMKSSVRNFIDKSYKISDTSSKNAVKIKAEKNVKNLLKDDLDLSALGFATKLPSGRYIDVKHNFFVTLYNIHMIYNIKNLQKKLVVSDDVVKNDAAVLKPEYYQKYADSNMNSDDSDFSSDFIDNIDEDLISTLGYNNQDNLKEVEVEDDYKLFNINNLNADFSISLPSFASYNNAQKIKGSVYYWALSKTEPTEIRLQYVVYSGWALSLIILSGIALLIYLARRIHRHDTLKRIGNNN